MRSALGSGLAGGHPRRTGVLAGLIAVSLTAGIVTVLVGSSFGERTDALAGEAIGTCYLRPPGTGTDVIGVPVDCGIDHDLQIVARFPIRRPDGPDADAALEAAIRDGCASGFEAFAGAGILDVEGLVLQRFMEIGPGPERLVVCTASREDRSPLVGSLQGKGRDFVPERSPGFARGPLDVSDLQVGDCLDRVEGSVTTVPAVPCSEPHDREVYAAFDLTPAQGAFPGSDEVATQARAGCIERFESAVGEPWETSPFDVVELAPTEESWSRGDREVLCMLYRLDGEPIPGRAQGIPSATSMRSPTQSSASLNAASASWISSPGSKEWAG